MKIAFVFAWYDLWVGGYWDRKARVLYVLPLPMVGIRIAFPNRIKVVCAWCGKFERTKPCAPAQHGLVSHGCCPACVSQATGELVGRHREIGPDPEGAR